MTTLPRRAWRDIRTLIVSPLSLLVAVARRCDVGCSRFLVPAGKLGPGCDGERAGRDPADHGRGTDAARGVVERAAESELPVPMSKGAKVQIITFSDYQCPGCRFAHDRLKPVLAKYDKGVVEFVLKHYPLEAECNPNVPGGNHYAACEAAAAYVMARGTGFQQKLDDWLFENQRSLTKDAVRQAAKDQAGISDFDARYTQALQEVKTDASLGGLLNITHTPTVYLNGRMIAGTETMRLPPSQYVDALIDIELKKSK